MQVLMYFFLFFFCLRRSMDIAQVGFTVAHQSSALLASVSHFMVCSSQTGLTFNSCFKNPIFLY